MPLIFRQLFDAASSTYTYLLADAGQAVLIDPVYEQAGRDAALLRELGLHLTATLETHVHADHVTAAWLLRERCGSRILISAASGAQGADHLLVDGDRIDFGSRQLHARATPGHTSGCMSYVLDDLGMAFSGDALLIRGCGRTDFQHGSAAGLYASVHEQLFSLPPACLIFPAHDYRGLTVSSVGEEQRHNPRLGGDASVGDFQGYMDNLKLPHPKRIDEAVPANLRCGEPREAQLPAPEPNWAPLSLSIAGIWQIEPAALAEHAGAVQIVDVREPEEWYDALGHIEGALQIPLALLTERRAELDAARPVAAVCRSGTRSAQAVALLTGAGFSQAVNLAGGMLSWQREGLPVSRRSR